MSDTEALARKFLAAAHGDTEMAGTCELAIYGATEALRESARIDVCTAINDAAAVDDA